TRCTHAEASSSVDGAVLAAGAGVGAVSAGASSVDGVWSKRDGVAGVGRFRRVGVGGGGGGAGGAASAAALTSGVWCHQAGRPVVVGTQPSRSSTASTATGTNSSCGVSPPW